MLIASPEIGVPRDGAKLKRAPGFSERPFLLAVQIALLEQELQAELEDAAQVRAVGLQEAVSEAGWISRGIV